MNLYLNMKKILAAAIIFIVLVGLLIKTSKKPVEKKLQKVTIMMPFTPSISWAAYYAAINKGFYNDEGLNVEMQYTPKGNAGAVEQLIAGKVDIIESGEESLIMSRSKGSEAVAIYPIKPANIYYVISEKSKKITKPAELFGKKVAVSSFGSGTYFNLLAMLNSADIDKNSVDIIDAGTSLVSAFFEKKFDAAAVQLYQRLLIEAKIPDLNIIKATDYSGISRQHLATTEKLIKNNPELLKKFLRASKKGLEYAVNHPEEAVDIFISLHPEAASQKKSDLFFWNSQNKEYKYKAGLPGLEKLEDWQKSQDDLFKIGLITEKTDVSAMFTNKFFPK